MLCVSKSCLTLWPPGLQHTGLLYPPLSPGGCSNLWPSSQWCHPAISSSVVLFFSCPQSFPASGNVLVLLIRWPKYWSFSFSTSPSNEYSELIFFRIDWFDHLAVQGTQETSPAPWFKGTYSSVISILYGPTLTSIHDSLKNHCFDYTDCCQQSTVFAF